MKNVDPYCEFVVGKGDHVSDPLVTSVDRNAGSTPSWHESLAIVIREKHEDYNNIKIVIWNKNSIRGDTKLGEVNIPYLASQVANHPNQQKWFTVTLNEDEKGELQLVFHYIPMSAAEILASYHVTESAPLRHGRCARRGRRTRVGSAQPTGIGQLLLAGASVAVAAATL